MIQRQASNAAPRCAAATTIRTLVSPISSRPNRWTIDTPLHRKTLPRLPRQRFHLFQRHRFIGFIVQIERAPATGVVPHDAIEDHGRAIRQDASTA